MFPLPNTLPLFFIKLSREDNTDVGCDVMVDGSIECLFVFTLGSSEYQMSFIDISVPVSQFHELLWEDENMYAGVNLPSFHHAADG